MKTILFLGDSLTEWNDWQACFPSHQVRNLGIAGETVGGLLSRLPGIISRYPSADMVLVMTGINNLAMGYSDFLGEYRSILGTLRSAYPQALMYVQAILPVAGDWIAPEEIVAVNKQLELLCRKIGGIAFLDTYSVFLDDQDRVTRAFLEPDGVHVSPQGYRAWEAFLRSVIGA